jgi:hypothetical protein
MKDSETRQVPAAIPRKRVEEMESRYYLIR